MTQSMIQPGAFVTIQSFMRNELGLKGYELIAYALIYGFSQDGASEFSGSASYIAEWCGISRENATRMLGRLVSKGLIEKRSFRGSNGEKRCSYLVTKRHTPSDETSLGLVTKRHKPNIDINIGDNIEDKYPPISPQVAEVVEHLNSRLGTRFSPKTRQTRESISARLSDGYTVKDLCDVVDSKADEWASDPKMSKYLNPTTLFRPGNFERYVNALRVSGGGVPDDFSAYR